MIKNRSSYVCQQCGYAQVGWSGKCPDCGTWGSMVETLVPTDSRSEAGNVKRVSVKPINLYEISSKVAERIKTGISELDRALGGGLVSGQVILIAGEPGIGKSTLLLEVANKLSAFYATGEESVVQVKLRADRLGVTGKSILMLEETDIDVILSSIVANIDRKIAPSVIVIDSIQTMFTSNLSGMAGSVGQIRECTYRIVRLAKKYGIPTFIVGHVTKEGAVAGPSVLTHLVDTVLWFEGDKNFTLRLIRAIKNRFGPTDEVGIFQMEEQGLKGIVDISSVFLSGSRKGVPGSVTSVVMEGSRPICIEIQSLIVPTKLAFPKRVVQGIDSKRVELLVAVLGRRCSIPVYEYDVFVNVTGGIFIKETGADLAISLSIASAFFDRGLPPDFIAVGEVGLLGELRGVLGQEKRVKEAKRLGYKIFATNREFVYLSEAIKKLFK
jgi:DNA repair protein RadA/Sms